MEKEELEKIKKEFHADFENEIDLENQIILERQREKKLDELKQSCLRTNSYAEKNEIKVANIKPSKKD